MRFKYNENDIEEKITQFIKSKKIVTIMQVANEFKLNRTHSAKWLRKIESRNEKIKSNLETENRGSLVVVVKYYKFQCDI